LRKRPYFAILPKGSTLSRSLLIVAPLHTLIHLTTNGYTSLKTQTYFWGMSIRSMRDVLRYVCSHVFLRDVYPFNVWCDVWRRVYSLVFMKDVYPFRTWLHTHFNTQHFTHSTHVHKSLNTWLAPPCLYTWVLALYRETDMCTYTPKSTRLCLHIHVAEYVMFKLHIYCMSRDRYVYIYTHTYTLKCIYTHSPRTFSIHIFTILYMYGILWLWPTENFLESSGCRTRPLETNWYGYRPRPTHRDAHRKCFPVQS